MNRCWIAFVLAALSGCVAPRKTGDQCLFSSDCPAPLVCAGQRCRAPCNTDRDCVGEERCRPSGVATTRVCLPPGQLGYCMFTPECDRPNVCDQRALQCIAGCSDDLQCERERGPGFRCATGRGLCEPTVLDAGAVDTGALDASSFDASVSDGATMPDAAMDGRDDAQDDVHDARADGGSVTDGDGRDAADASGADVSSDAPGRLEPAGCATPITHRFLRACATPHGTCALALDGAVYCWGSNASGQCAQPTSTESFDRPQRIGALTGMIDLGCSSHETITVGGLSRAAAHACAMRADGAVFCWGDNRRGQLGQGTGAPSIVTTPVRFTVTDAGATIDRFARMRVSRMGVHVVDVSGRLFFAGRSVFNGAGLGPPGEVFALVSPAQRVPTPTAVNDLWAGYGSSIAPIAGATRALYFGQVNDSVTFGPAGARTVLATATEVPLASLGVPTRESPLARGAAEPQYFIAVLEDGRGFAWGNNVESTLGNDAAPSTGGDRAWAITVPPIAAIATTETRAFAVDRAGDLWVWGSVARGSPLPGATAAVRAPQRIPAVYDAMDIAATTTHQCAVRADGRMLCWGCNNFGALGRGGPTGGGGTASLCTVRTGEGEVGYVCF